MRPIVKALTGLALLLFGGLVAAQTGTPPLVSQPQPGTTPGQGAAAKKSALEEALEKALKNNPDLRVAVARLAEAEAVVSRTRLQVVQKVAGAYQAVEAARADADAAVGAAERMNRAVKAGTVSRQELTAALSELAKAKARIAAAEAELSYLQGKSAGEGKPGVGASDRDALFLGGRYVVTEGYPLRPLAESPYSTASAKALLSTTSSDKLRTALAKKVGDWKTEGTPEDLYDYIKEKAGINIHADRKTNVWKEQISAGFKDVTIGAMLQFLEGVLPGHRILVREYGLLIVPESKVPAGALTLSVFLTGRTDPYGRAAIGLTTTKENRVEGKVKRVEGTQVAISIGSDAGIEKGQQLEVFRLSPKPEFVGKIRVVEVSANLAVCEVVGKAIKVIKENDTVTTILERK